MEDDLVSNKCLLLSPSSMGLSMAGCILQLLEILSHVSQLRIGVIEGPWLCLASNHKDVVTVNCRASETSVKRTYIAQTRFESYNTSTSKV